MYQFNGASQIHGAPYSQSGGSPHMNHLQETRYQHPQIPGHVAHQQGYQHPQYNGNGQNAPPQNQGYQSNHQVHAQQSNRQYPPQAPNNPYPKPYQVYDEVQISQNGNHAISNGNTSAQACYNCGAYDHWAQDCPEPRRANPVGRINNARPPKRQRTTGPIVTQFGSQATPVSHPGLQRGWTHPPPTQNVLSTPGRSPPVVSTPISDYQQWPQKQSPNSNQFYSHPHNPQQYSQGGQESMQTQQPQQNSHTGQNYGHPQSRQPSYSGQAHFQQRPPQYPHPDQNHLQPPLPPQQWPAPNAPVSTSPAHHNFPSYPPYRGSQNTPASIQSTPNRQESFSSATPLSRQGSVVTGLGVGASPQQDPASSLQGSIHSRPPSVKSCHEEVEPWLEELLTLNFEELKPATGPIVSHPANPVAQPLASTMFEADAVGRLPIAASLIQGMSVSSYFRDSSECNTMKRIDETEDWSTIRDDPAFQDINLNGVAICVSELIARRNEVMIVLEDSDIEEANLQKEDNTDDENEDRENLPRHSHKYSDSLQGSGVFPSRSHSPETEPDRLAREQEGKLAALGVTGNAKPVQPEMKKGRSAANSDLGGDRSRSRSPTRDNFGNRRDMGPRRDSYRRASNGGSIDHSHLPTPEEASVRPHRYGSRSPGYDRHYYDDSRHDRSYPQSRSRHYDGPANFERSPTDMHATDEYANGEDHSPGHGHRYHDQSSSWNNTYHSRSDPYENRKRSYHQYSSEESDGGPKRQKEETPQRNRARAPKIAAAYSRRW